MDSWPNGCCSRLTCWSRVSVAPRGAPSVRNCCICSRDGASCSFVTACIALAMQGAIDNHWTNCDKDWYRERVRFTRVRHVSW